MNADSTDARLTFHMNAHPYKHPPLMKAYLAHAIGTALLGAVLPSGEYLEVLHRLMLPIVELIPNAMRITERAPDPMFAQTFIGLSLVIALAILLYFVVAVRGYHTKTFATSTKRWLALIYVWAIVLVMLGVAWFMPYLDPLSMGRTYFFLKAAASSNVGVLTVMNQLIVGLPLASLLTIWGGHACTNVRNRTQFF